MKSSCGKSVEIWRALSTCWQGYRKISKFPGEKKTNHKSAKASDGAAVPAGHQHLYPHPEPEAGRSLAAISRTSAGGGRTGWDSVCSASLWPAENPPTPQSFKPI